MRRLAPADCAVSIVTIYELFCGVEKAQHPAPEREKVQRFISAIVALPFDRRAAEAAAGIRADLERRGQTIGPYDLLIAGHALASGLILVTNNLREFQRVGGLKLESWS